MSNRFKEAAHRRDAQREMDRALAQHRLDVEQATILVNRGALFSGHLDDGYPRLQCLLMLDIAVLTKALTTPVNLEVRHQQADEALFTPLLAAIAGGRHQHAQALLHAGASIKAKTGQGTMPNTQWDNSSVVHLATLREDPVILKMLLDAGSVAAARDGFGRSPLHILWRLQKTIGDEQIAKRLAVIDLLLHAGVDPNQPIRGARAATTATNDRPLHLAAEAGTAQEVTRLLQAGADPTSLDKDACTPLVRAQRATPVNAEVVVVLERLALKGMMLEDAPSEPSGKVRRRL